jgi:hypothetical protein
LRRSLSSREKKYEVSMYAIKLPPGPDSQRSSSREHRDHPFIGIKAHKADANIRDAACTASEEVSMQQALLVPRPEPPEDQVSSASSSLGISTCGIGTLNWASESSALFTAPKATQTEYVRPPVLPPSAEPSREAICAFTEKHIMYGKRLLKRCKQQQAHRSRSANSGPSETLPRLGSTDSASSTGASRRHSHSPPSGRRLFSPGLEPVASAKLLRVRM